MGGRNRVWLARCLRLQSRLRMMHFDGLKARWAQHAWGRDTLVHYLLKVVDLVALLVMFVGWRATQPSTACGSVIMNGDSPWRCIGPDQVFSGSPHGLWYIAIGISVLALKAREVVRPLIQYVPVYFIRLAREYP